MSTQKLLLSALLVCSVAGWALARGPAKRPAGPPPAPPGPTIVDVAIAANEELDIFNTLIAALLCADPLVLDTLSGNGQFTVFAPTDDAFADLGLDAESVCELDPKTLTDILLYHVARGRRLSEDVLASSRIRMLKGGFLMQDEGILTDALGREAAIIVVDVEAANGVIHVIDRVVLPYAP